MRFACWIPKATNTHSEYVIVTAFPLQQLLHTLASMLRFTYNYPLVGYCVVEGQIKIGSRVGESCIIIIIIIIIIIQLRTASFKAYFAFWVRRSNFRRQASPRVSPRESTQRRKVKL